MKKTRTRVFSILLACALVLGMMPMGVFAGTEGGETVTVASFDDLKDAQDASEGSVVEVSGDIEMTEGITFQNKITLKLTETAKITYESDNNETLYLITLQDGSTVNFAKGASISMIGDTENRTDGRDWRVIRSLGTLNFEQCAGSVTVINAKGRAFYGTKDIVFNCDMAANITIDNTVGANRYVFAIYAPGNVIINGDLSGSIDVDFGGGNTAAGIYADGITIDGDISGEVDVQLGSSHNAFGLYAYTSGVVVTGDISGSIYARGGSSNGYGIVAENGDISIAEISGSVTGDCYNKVMANSQSGASAIYADNGSIYGSKNGEVIQPIHLTGTLSSTVGRSGAFTVQAEKDVYIEVGKNALIKAQSSYGAGWADLRGDYTNMSDNWGGTAACVAGNGTVNVTGTKANLSAISVSEKDTTVTAAGPLVDIGNTDSLTRIDNFLMYSSLAVNDQYDAYAIKANAALTNEDKKQIAGYDELVKNFATEVEDENDLIKALTDAADGAIIILKGNITLQSGLPDISRKNLTIIGENEQSTLSFKKSAGKLNGIFGNDVTPLYAGTNLTVKNLIIENTGEQGAYASIVGYDADGTIITYENCTFKNLYSAVYVNPFNAKPSKGVSLNITDCNYENTRYGYSIDKSSSNTYQLTNVSFEGNSGDFTQEEMLKNVIQVISPDGTVQSFSNGYPYSNGSGIMEAAVNAAEDGSKLIVYPGKYDGNVTFGGKSLTIKAQYPAYVNGEQENDENLSKFTGTFNTSEGTDDSAFQKRQTVVIDGIALSGDGLKIGNCNYNTVGNLEVRHCTMEFGKNLTQPENYNGYNYFVKTSGNNGTPYASVIVEDNYISGAPQTNVYPIQLWDVENVEVRNNVVELKNADDHQAISVSKMAKDAKVNITGNTIEGAGGGIYVTTWLLDGDSNNATAMFTGTVTVQENKLVCAESGSMEPIFIGYEDVEGAPYGLLGGTQNIQRNTNKGEPVDAVIIRGPEENTDLITATFKDGDSVIYTISNKTAAGKLTIKLPAAPEKSGYKFVGWSDGNQTYLSDATVEISKDTIFNAQWSVISSGGGGGTVETKYDISVDSAANGTVKASASTSAKDKTVTLTVTPDEGYVLDTLTVTDKDGKNVELTKKSDTEYTFQMPESKVTVKAVFKEESAESSLPFSDVSSADWFYTAVKYVYDNDMMNGVSDDRFAPASQLTRGMIAQVLYNLEKVTGDFDGSFTDVAADEWYADAVNWAAECGIVNGFGDGTFGPEQNITREQMAQILMNYAKYKGYDVTAKGDVSAFTDAAEISGWAQDAVSWAVAEKLLSGKGNGILDPAGTATRAEVAQIFMNFCENIAK